MQTAKSFAVLALFLTLAADTPGQRPQSGDDDYELVFSDDFSGPRGSSPNAAYWSCSPRGNSTWNRWVSPSPQVAFLSGGKLICRAIPNTSAPTDTAQMLTGAVETMHKFAFQYGKVEVRARIRGHRGSFPAIWLMPEEPAPPHPDGGEIDIVETIDDRHTAFHNVHSRWTLTLGKSQEPRNSFSEDLRTDRWHVYGLIWEADKLVWQVDGKTVAYYLKSNDNEALAQGQWPFDRPFYIILNQSVGIGRWASTPDLSHTYETQFDWVRVYQRTRRAPY